mgnify:CR=1 FL=1
MKELIRSLACALCKALSPPVVAPSEPRPVTNFTLISRDDFLAKLAPLGIIPISLLTPLDSQLSVVDKATLDTLAPYLTFAADLYVNDIADCEDYAIEAQSKASFKYHVSGIRLALGQSPLGYHGFALALDTDGNIWLMEPNAGFPYAGGWFKIGYNSYIPDKVFV